MKSIKDWQRPDEGKLGRLPKWASEYIDLLEMRLAEQEGLVEQFASEGVDYRDIDPEKLYIQRDGDELHREIGLRSRVRLPLGNGCTAEVRVDRSGRGGIEVMTSSQLAVLPQVTNVVRIIGVDRSA